MIEFERIFHYQLSFFSPCPVLEPSPQIISKFLQAFEGTELMPTTIPVIHFGPNPETRQMLQFITANTGWRIEFEPNRISCNKVADQKKNIGTPEDFFREAEDYCSRVISVLGLKSNRLAFVTKGILPEMSGDQLKSLYLKLFKPPKFYLDNESLEWSSRNAACYNSNTFNKNEIFNVITDINFIKIIDQEKGHQKESPRIEIGFDINTTQKNTDLRFSANDIGPFLLETMQLINQVSADIKEGLL